MGIENRFWGYVKRGAPNECWPWTRSCFKFGHGRFWINGKTRQAHRIAWALSHGSLADDVCVLHRCDNPPCCNPAHLFLGSQIDNMLDRDAKGKAPIGERNGRAILNAKSVFEIRKLAGTITQAELAINYGVSPATISLVIGRKIWAS